MEFQHDDRTVLAAVGGKTLDIQFRKVIPGLPHVISPEGRCEEDDLLAVSLRIALAEGPAGFLQMSGIHEFIDPGNTCGIYVFDGHVEGISIVRSIAFGAHDCMCIGTMGSARNAMLVGIFPVPAETDGLEGPDGMPELNGFHILWIVDQIEEGMIVITEDDVGGGEMPDEGDLTS